MGAAENEEQLVLTGHDHRGPHGAGRVPVRRACARCRRAAGDERGAVLVEFALVLPIFVILLVGTFTAAMAFNRKQQLTYATREGARYAATIPANQVWSGGGTWASNVSNLIVERAGSDLSSGLTVCVSLVEGSGAGLSVVAPAGTYSTSGAPCIANQTYPTTATDPGRRVQVVTSRPDEITLAILPAVRFTLKASSTAKSESST